MFPATSVDLPVLNQNTNVANIGAVQPLTDLLKVRQGVKIAQADQQIAQAQEEEGIRKVASGVEQLYWGLLAVRRIQAGAVEGLQGAEMIAKTGSLDARTALVEARKRSNRSRNRPPTSRLNSLACSICRPARHWNW